MNVGDYVRTKYGRIGKIININKAIIFKPNTFMENLDDIKSESVSVMVDVKHDYEDENDSYLIEDIIKISPDIIDLIEENDYINGIRIEKNKYGELYTSYVYYGGDTGKQSEVYTIWLKEYSENMINNIVTHEQFESMEYKL